MKMCVISNMEETSQNSTTTETKTQEAGQRHKKLARIQFDKDTTTTETTTDGQEQLLSQTVFS